MGHGAGTSQIGKGRGVGRSESQETAPTPPPRTGLRGRTRATAVYHSLLVLGGARSGKSRHALEQARHGGNSLAFLATALALGGALATPIARHRADPPPPAPTIQYPHPVPAPCA